MEHQSYPGLFTPFAIRHVQFRNRIVSTAHGTYMPKLGLQTEQIAAYHSERAHGGTGLIILEATSTHPSGIGAPRYATAHTDECIPGYKMVFDAIHAAGVPAFVQLYHPGKDDIAGGTSDGTIAPSYSASAVLCEANQLMPRVMSRRLLREVVASYGSAAKRLIASGADGIEISAHHGHLIAQFLDPRINLRDDEYGGSSNGRFKLLADILDMVREAIGSHPILGVRLTCGEMSSSGITTEEGLETAVAVDQRPDVDFIHITPGSTASFDGIQHVAAPMAFSVAYAKDKFLLFRQHLKKPLITTGRVNDPAIADKMVLDNYADLVGMTRALICDPEMPNKAKSGLGDHIRACIACNQACIGHGKKGGVVSCIQNPRAGRELGFRRDARSTKARRVLIAGGGPAGMKAAVVAAERGHQVTLFERNRRLGGQARLAEMLPGRSEFGGLITNLENELQRFQVDVRFNSQVDRETIEKERPDAIVLATGGRANYPDIPGADEMSVVHAWDIITGAAAAGRNVVVADTKLDWAGVGVAEKLARAGSVVTLCVIGYSAGDNLPTAVKANALGALYRLGVKIEPLMRLGGCSGSTVFFEHATSADVVSFDDIDTLVLSYGAVGDTQLEDTLEDYPGEVHVIGDCLSPRTAEEAILEGLKVGYAL